VSQSVEIFTFLRGRRLRRPWDSNENSISFRQDFLRSTHHPQNEFENPLTALNCFVVKDETPPKIEEYGSLKKSPSYHKILQKPSQVSLESKCVNGDTHVARLIWTSIQVTIVHWQQVNIVKNKAVPLVEFQSLNESYVHQLGAVERAIG
jgi:hypothetical protein